MMENCAEVLTIAKIKGSKLKMLKDLISGRPLCVMVCGKHSGLGTLASCSSQDTRLLQAQIVLCGTTSQVAGRAFFKIHFTGERRGVSRLPVLAICCHRSGSLVLGDHLLVPWWEPGSISRVWIEESILSQRIQLHPAF